MRQEAAGRQQRLLAGSASSRPHLAAAFRVEAAAVAARRLIDGLVTHTPARGRAQEAAKAMACAAQRFGR